MRYWRIVAGRARPVYHDRPVSFPPTTIPKQEEIMTTAANPGGKKGMGKYLKKTPSLVVRLRIVKWLEAHKNELLAERPRYAKVTEDINKELMIDVTEQTVHSTAKAAEIFWKEIPNRKDTSKKHPSHNMTRARVVNLQRQVLALRKALQILCTRIGESHPAEITDLWPVMELADLGKEENSPVPS